MNNIKQGDILEFIGDDVNKSLSTREVMGVCGKIVFTRNILSNGFSPSEFDEIEDLETFGWKIKN